MIKKLVTFTVTFFLLLLVLIFYNYQKAQTNLRQTRQTRFSIEFLDAPGELTANQPGVFAWKVDAPNSYSAKSTGIYWNYESSPSALTKIDSPQAVMYPNYTEDFASGLFQLPDTFDLNLKFPKAGTVYIRAYALVDRDYLWTEERSLTVK
jgi:hypothetical protein